MLKASFRNDGRGGSGGRVTVGESAEPAIGPGQLLVRTEAVGVSQGLVRALGSPESLRDPGGELVGHVVALGPGVESFSVGDRVGGVALEGVFAQRVVVVPQLVSPVPDAVAPADALALVRGGLVALSALRAGGFAPGESVLVTAAASGAGHLAVQLAKALGGGRVAAGVGSAGKAAFVRECGADEVFTYADESWGEPVDVVLDGLGGDAVQRGVDVLAPHGRLVAFSAGGGTVDAGSLLGGLKSVIGFSMALISRQQPELLRERRAELWGLLAQGRISPRTAVFEFDDAGFADALALIAARENLGRVLLRTG